MQLISNFSAFEFFKRKINATASILNILKKKCIQYHRGNSFQNRNAIPAIPQMLHNPPRISLFYVCPQPIPLLLMAPAMLCFLCSSSLCRPACRLRLSPEQPCKTRWGVVQLVGHLTVNEDGEGSNPSAPANLIDSLRFIFCFSNNKPLSNNCG